MIDSLDIAIAICKSRTCEGINCCQWPSNRGRRDCPVRAGGYDDAAQAVIAIVKTERAAGFADALKQAAEMANARFLVDPLTSPAVHIEGLKPS